MNESVLAEPAAADWARLRPVIDGALDELEERDREAVLLRYFEGRSYAEVGARLRLNENAARMRVDRALERMHALLTRRGVSSSVAALALALSGAAAVTAPTGLAATVTGVALSGAVAASGAAGGLALFAFMSTSKIVTGVATLVAVMAVGVAYNQTSASKRAREDQQVVRDERDRALARVHVLERTLAEEKARAQAAEKDTGTLLAAVDRAKAATEAQANAPITHEIVQARFKRAQDLARAGNWEAALPELLWCYDEGMVRVESFYGVRLSFLLSELGRMASHYPPAMAALRERRDRAAKSMESTNDFRIAAEFSALNATLGEDALTLKVFEGLPAGDPRRQGLVGPVFDQLLAAKRYTDAASALPYAQMTTRFAQVTRDMPVPANTPNAEQMKNSLRKMAVNTTAKNIEALAGAGKLDQARELLGKLAAYDSSNETNTIIRDHLARAGHPELMAAPAQ